MSERMDKFNELQRLAEWYYSKGMYKTAKSYYTEMLKYTKDGTDKQNRVLSCIDDMNHYLESQ